MRRPIARFPFAKAGRASLAGAAMRARRRTAHASSAVACAADTPRAAGLTAAACRIPRPHPPVGGSLFAMAAWQRIAAATVVLCLLWMVIAWATAA